MKLSCIVPTLNEEDNVKGFLEGYSIQTEKFHELIFVDGHSKDKTADIIKEYQKKFPEIKLLICDKKGPSAARNMGLDNANGEYITYMDVDWKLLSKETLRQIFHYLKEIDEVIFLQVYNNRKVNFKGLKKYFYLKDKNNTLVLIKKKVCPRYDETLGFGEDRLYGVELKKLKFKMFKLTDSDVGLCRAEGKMNLSKFMRRYNWYGRTIPFYLIKTKDFKYAIGYFVYVISIIPIFWFIPFLRGFIKGIKNFNYGLDVPFGLGFIEIMIAIGTSIGFLQWLFGVRDVGRDIL